MSRRVMLTAGALLAMTAVGCAMGPDADPEAYELPGNPAGVTHGVIDFESLRSWNRYPGGPVYRDRVPGYEVASDAHVFHDRSGTLRMIYTGDSEGHASIKMAVGSAYDSWEPAGVLLPGGATPSASDTSGKETAYYYHNAERGTHQIYYIAYDDGDTTSAYEGEIYVAEADSIEGPYTMSDTPIIAQGVHAGHDVYAMTSPSVVESDGDLYLAFLGWDNPPDVVTAVWVLGAVSTDNGRTWGAVEEIEAPIGMEGQITRAPDGMYYATRTSAHEGAEALFLERSRHPFGPYENAFGEPILEKGGGGWEKDEIIASQVTFNPLSKRAYLYYTGADHAKGWWMMVAWTPYTAAAR